MSPRSEEFRETAERKLASARASLAAGFSEDAAAAGYYTMLYAARAALSEEDLHAKTHNGTWTLFSRQFMRTGRLDSVLQAWAEDAREKREQADYGGGGASAEEATLVIERAERFLAEIERLFP